MPPRGRKPIPTALKLISGSNKTHPERINDDEPVPEDGLPSCPATDKLVREVWDYAIDQLRKMRVITMADRDMLLAYCQAVVMHRRASQLLDAEGYLISAAAGLFPHPAVRMQRDAAAMMKSLGTEFGFTPAARTRIKVADQLAPKESSAGASRLLSS